MTQDEMIRRWQAQRAAKGLPINWTGVQYAARVANTNRVGPPSQAADELGAIRDANAAALRGGR